MKSNPEWLDQLYATGKQVVNFLFLGIIGLAPRIAAYAKEGKVTKMQVIITFVCGFSCGFMVWQLLKTYQLMNMAGVFIPLSTLMGEGIVMWVLRNQDSILKFFSDKLMKGPKA